MLSFAMRLPGSRLPSGHFTACQGPCGRPLILQRELHDLLAQLVEISIISVLSCSLCRKRGEFVQGAAPRGTAVAASLVRGLLFRDIFLTYNRMFRCLVLPVAVVSSIWDN